MKCKIALLIVGTLLSTPVSAIAKPQYPYACVWTSQMDSKAKIQFISTNGIGGYQGAVYYGDKWIMNISEGSFQGYGSNWWHAGSLGGDKTGGSNIVTFKNGMPARSTSSRQPNAETKVLTVGLGSHLYYGGQRDNPALIRAAEGFWIPGKGCRHINGRF